MATIVRAVNVRGEGASLVSGVDMNWRVGTVPGSHRDMLN
jgi:hypothetical protein